MMILIIFLILLYIAIGIITSCKTFKNPIGVIVGSLILGVLWLPIVISDYIASYVSDMILKHRGE